jgi:hypothetical protein
MIPVFRITIIVAFLALSASEALSDCTYFERGQNGFRLKTGLVTGRETEGYGFSLSGCANGSVGGKLSYRKFENERHNHSTYSAQFSGLLLKEHAESGHPSVGLECGLEITTGLLRHKPVAMIVGVSLSRNVKLTPSVYIQPFGTAHQAMIVYDGSGESYTTTAGISLFRVNAKKHFYILTPYLLLREGAVGCGMDLSFAFGSQNEEWGQRAPGE